jgi:DNA-binding MarR family transcriptional regulator
MLTASSPPASTIRNVASTIRSRLIALTPYGREVVERVLQARLQTLEAFAAELTSDERDSLHAVILPIVERIARQ